MVIEFESKKSPIEEIKTMSEIKELLPQEIKKAVEAGFKNAKEMIKETTTLHLAKAGGASEKLSTEELNKKAEEYNKNKNAYHDYTEQVKKIKGEGYTIQTIDGLDSLDVKIVNLDEKIDTKEATLKIPMTYNDFYNNETLRKHLKLVPKGEDNTIQLSEPVQNALITLQEQITKHNAKCDNPNLKTQQADLISEREEIFNRGNIIEEVEEFNAKIAPYNTTVKELNSEASSLNKERTNLQNQIKAEITKVVKGYDEAVTNIQNFQKTMTEILKKFLEGKEDKKSFASQDLQRFPEAFTDFWEKPLNQSKEEIKNFLKEQFITQRYGRHGHITAFFELILDNLSQQIREQATANPPTIEWGTKTDNPIQVDKEGNLTNGGVVIKTKGELNALNLGADKYREFDDKRYRNTNFNNLPTIEPTNK